MISRFNFVLALGVAANIIFPLEGAWAQQLEYKYLKGSWVNDDSSSLGRDRGFTVDNRRNVYTRNYGLQGRVTESGRWGSNFIFEGSTGRESFLCAYDVTFFKNNDSARFRLVKETPLGAGCPDGRFSRAMD